MEVDLAHPPIGVEQSLEYEPPEVVDYGDLVELTSGQSHGPVLDSDFHTGGHFGHPTFSH